MPDSGSQIPIRSFVYLVYADDAGSTGENLSDPQSPFQVLGCVLVREDLFSSLELNLSITLQKLVPEKERKSFEFHAH